MKKYTDRLVRFLSAGVVGSILLGGCDVLQKDTIPDKEKIRIVDNQVVITPKSSGIIDLHSMVQAYEEVRISVASQPGNGKLNALENDLVRYTANSGFVNGRDAFKVSISSGTGDFIKTDSVIIIVKSDSTNLPCSLMALNDYRYNVQTTIEIDVLANDVVCPSDRSQVIVSMANGAGAAQYSFGNVEVLANKKIRYSPAANVKGLNQFNYKIVKPENVPNQGDRAQTSYGVVFLTGPSSCKDSLSVVNDQVDITFAAINVNDTIRIFPTSNDVICRQSATNFQLTVPQQSQGKLFYNTYSPYQFKYLLPSGASAGFKDEFTYRICVDDVCKEGQVKLNFN